MIPHRMFVAVRSGGRHAPAPQSGPPLQLLVRPFAPGAGVLIEERGRRDAVSIVAMRRVIEAGPRGSV